MVLIWRCGEAGVKGPAGGLNPEGNEAPVGGLLLAVSWRSPVGGLPLAVSWRSPRLRQLELMSWGGVWQSEPHRCTTFTSLPDYGSRGRRGGRGAGRGGKGKVGGGGKNSLWRGLGQLTRSGDGV